MNKAPLHIVLISLAGLIVYSNTLNVPFQWDETLTITENPIVKELRYFIHPSEAKGFVLNYYSFRDRYMGYLTFALNYRLHGLDVRGYHVVNITLHILNSLLVYALLRLTLRTPFMKNALTLNPSPGGRGIKGEGVALFVALIFVSHPVQTEAVTYVMGRLPLLMWFFYLSSMVLYAKWRLTSLTLNPSPTGRGQGVRVFFYLLSLLSAVLAMKTKENALTLPFSIALYEFSFFTHPHPPLTKGGERGGRRLLYLLPFLLTLLIIPLSLMSFDKPVGEVIGGIESASRHYTETPRMSYLFTQFRVLVTYLRLLFLPINQNFDYDYPVYDSFFNPQVLISFMFLLSVFSLGVFSLVRSRNRNPSLRLLAWGIFWFFLTLSVESSIFPIPMIISEYRLYAPSLGVFVAVISALMLFAPKRLTIAALAVIVIVFSSAAYARNDLWRNSITLWEDVVKKSPSKARAHFNLGYNYEQKGMLDKAVEHYETAIKYDPNEINVRNNLGNISLAMGLRERALEHYKAALLAGSDYKTHYNLGVFYMEGGELDRAIEHFSLSLSRWPYLAEAHNNLCSVYLFKGRPDEAIGHCMDALRLNPGYAGAHYNLGIAYSNKGQTDMAVRHYEEALRLKPDFLEAHGNLGALYREAGETAKAQEHLLKAEELKGALNK